VAASLGQSLEFFEAADEQRLPDLFDRIKRSSTRALIVIPDPVFSSRRPELVALAAKLGRPAIFGTREFAEAGGLLAFGPDYVTLARRAAVYVDRILKGAKPSDLPVEQATHFELSVNLKTARALGLAIPQPFLLRADRVIE
jgi:putative ABC transport system substrate-binding protein